MPRPPPRGHGPETTRVWRVLDGAATSFKQEGVGVYESRAPADHRNRTPTPSQGPCVASSRHFPQALTWARAEPL